MEIINIESKQQLLAELSKNQTNYILIYKDNSEVCKCAYNAIKDVEEIKGIKIFGVNVSNVRDIHQNYNVTSAPTLLELKKDKLIKDIKGCNTSNYYKSLFQNSLYVSSNSADEKGQKRVTVYSTPTCSWCTRLKQYLKMNNIKFRDVDVSKDQAAAQAMVRKSGQQGVPQTDINGQIIVGFDKPKINRLLGIAG